MAKKVTKKKAAKGTHTIESVEDIDYKSMMREILSHPAVKYIAGGIGIAMLTRVANRLSRKYPEISHFLNENIESMEMTLANWKAEVDETSRMRH